MSLCADENLNSDLLLTLDFGSHVCVKVNPESKAYLTIKDKH